MMTCGVYQLTAPSGKTYIGSSINCERRYKGHKTRAQKGSHPNPHLMRAFRKYGELAFRLLIICRPEDRIIYEQVAINALKPEYNVSKIAGVVEWTPELRQRRAAAADEYWSRPGTRQNVSDFHKGRKRSAKTCDNISAATTIQMNKPGATDALIARNKARIWTPEARAKQDHWSGKKQSSESNVKRSSSMKGRPKSEQTKENMRKAQRLRFGTGA